MRKSFFIVFVLIILIFAEGFLIFNQSRQQKNRGTDKKTVDLVVTSVGFNPVFYPIKNNKIPQPEGTKVNLKTADYGGAQFYTLSSKNHPMVGILSSINLGITHNKGYNFTVLAPYYREIIGKDGRSMGQLVVKKNSSIKEPRDLYGKKIADTGKMGGSTIALKTVLKEKYQLDLNEIFFTSPNTNALPSLLEKGDVDAAMFDSDHILIPNFDEKYRTLVDFSKDMEELYGAIPPAKFFVVKKELYDQDPALYKKTVQFFKENYQWGVENINLIAEEEAHNSGKDYHEIIKHTQYESRLDDLKPEDLVALSALYKTAQEEKIIDEIPNMKELFNFVE
jgi:ABC-type taurine transport system substrate-binding protein